MRRHGLALAFAAPLMMAGLVAPPPRARSVQEVEIEKERERRNFRARNYSESLQRKFTPTARAIAAERIAKAEAKRGRKAAKRLRDVAAGGWAP